MTIKLSTQKDALKQVNRVIHRMISSVQEVEKINCTIEHNNGRIITRIEIVQKSVL